MLDHISFLFFRRSTVDFDSVGLSPVAVEIDRFSGHQSLMVDNGLDYYSWLLRRNEADLHWKAFFYVFLWHCLSMYLRLNLLNARSFSDYLRFTCDNLSVHVIDLCYLRYRPTFLSAIRGSTQNEFRIWILLTYFINSSDCKQWNRQLCWNLFRQKNVRDKCSLSINGK